MKRKKLISIIIPVFNEEKTILQILTKVKKSNTCGFKKEIIVVNDGSTDNTLKKLKKNNKDIKIISYKNNCGKGYAVRKGIGLSCGDIVLIQDADLEYDPENYPDLINPFIKKNVDVVFGSRFISNKPRRVLYIWHFLGNNFLTFFSNMFTGLNLSDIETGYKVFKGDLIRKIIAKLTSNKFGFEIEIIALLSKIKNIRIYEVGVSYYGRTYEEGKKISWKDGVAAIFETIYFNLFRR